jgi:hypothetical protein
MPTDGFAALAALPDAYLATCFGVPPEQVPARRAELGLAALDRGADCHGHEPEDGVVPPPGLERRHEDGEVAVHDDRGRRAAIGDQLHPGLSGIADALAPVR